MISSGIGYSPDAAFCHSLDKGLQVEKSCDTIPLRVQADINGLSYYDKEKHDELH